MLRIINTQNKIPQSFIVDPKAQFLPGQIAQLKRISDGCIVCGTSDGTYFTGIIDDIKTSVFTRNAVDEVIFIPLNKNDYFFHKNKYFTTSPINVEVGNPNIILESFISSIPVNLISPINGVMEIPKETELNFLNNKCICNKCICNQCNTFDGINIKVSYTYKIHNPGDDSTQGSGLVTVWTCTGFRAQTDQFEIGTYYKNDNLFVSKNGKFTNVKQSYYIDAIAWVVSPPTNEHPVLEFEMI